MSTLKRTTLIITSLCVVIFLTLALSSMPAWAKEIIDIKTDTTVSAEQQVMPVDEASSIQVLAANEPSVEVSDGGIFTITSAVEDSKVVDVTGGSLENEARVQIYSENSTMAQLWMFNDLGDSYYEIVNIGSGKALDVSGGKAFDGSPVQQYDRNQTAAQKWLAESLGDGAYTFHSAIENDYVLDLAGANSANGTPLQLWTANGTAAQIWKLGLLPALIQPGYYTIANSGSGKALDVAGGAFTDAANVWQYEPNGTNAQTFEALYDFQTGYYTFTNVKSSKVLDVAGNGTAYGTNVWQYASNGTTAQKWLVSPFGDGSYAIVAANSGLVLDVSGGSSESGANIQIYGSNHTLAQKWFFVVDYDLLPEGSYTVIAMNNLDNVMDISGGSVDSGANVQVYASNSTNAQRWTFAKTDGGYTILNPVSGLFLNRVSAISGSNVVLGAAPQVWRISYANGGFLIAPYGTDLALDIYGNDRNSGANLQIYASNGTLAQRFTFTETEPIKPKSIAAITYDYLWMTLDQMAWWQKDGNSYVGANSFEAIRAALDPANVSQSQFYDLRISAGVSASVLNAFIESRPRGREGNLCGLGDAFVSAAQACGLNEVYLLAHAILESGWGTSTLAQGYYYAADGKTYYNFFGYGANDSNALAGGRSTAQQYDWCTREKAVTGCASLIANGYIYRSSYSQPTLYAMRWDYNRSNDTGEIGWHQYATGLSWASDIASIMDSIYAFAGIDTSAFARIIPIYA